jgi:hypothetical protein
MAPPLSVVIAVREGLAEITAVLGALVPPAEATGTEVVIVGDLRGEQPPAGPVRLIDLPTEDIYALRRRGVEESRGEVVAIGEDHAVPRPDWCSAVIRAHAEHPEAAAIAGCLVNATDATLAGRANFLAFAASWQPPMPVLPGDRPPPSSALSFKRSALAEIGSRPTGWFEASLIPALFEAGKMAADERIVVDHFQDHGSLWAVRNAYDSARASYGYERPRLSSAERRKVARWSIANVPGRLRREARDAARGAPVPAPERALISLIAAGAGLGATLGTIFGPGRSPIRVA